MTPAYLQSIRAARSAISDGSSLAGTITGAPASSAAAALPEDGLISGIASNVIGSIGATLSDKGSLLGKVLGGRAAEASRSVGASGKVRLGRPFDLRYFLKTTGNLASGWTLGRLFGGQYLLVHLAKDANNAGVRSTLVLWIDMYS